MYWNSFHSGLTCCIFHSKFLRASSVFLTLFALVYTLYMILLLWIFIIIVVIIVYYIFLFFFALGWEKAIRTNPRFRQPDIGKWTRPVASWTCPGGNWANWGKKHFPCCHYLFTEKFIDLCNGNPMCIFWVHLFCWFCLLALHVLLTAGIQVVPWDVW